MNVKDRQLQWTAVAIVAITIIALSIWMVNRNMIDTKEVVQYKGHGGTLKNTLAEMDTPDPSVLYKNGYYYMTFTHNGTDVMLLKSRTLDFRQAERKVVWYPPMDTMYSAHLWAPEIQYIQGKWYIYFAADNGVNDNHRMYALEADSEDPMGTYSFKGQVKDDSNTWAIDGLVLEHEEKLYFVWSGWEGDINTQQNTYIAPMSDPVTISGPRLLISEPDLEWEQAGGPPYINEGQSILKKDGNVYLVYSGAGSWTPFYSLGMLTLSQGADPLVAANWKKSKEPLLKMDESVGVYGPGHNSFVTSPEGSEDWIIYHATSGSSDGWNNRKARAQKVVWNEAGSPEFGKPLSLDTAIPVPSGMGVYLSDEAKRTEDKLEFDLIPSAVESSVPVLVHYTNVSGKTSMIDISVNDTNALKLELPAIAENETGYAYTYVALSSGQNSIHISLGNQDVQVHAMEIPRYEAENAQAAGGARSEENPFSSGWGVMKLVNEEEAQLHFGNIAVPVKGNYKLRLAVSNAAEQEITFKISTNQGKHKTVKVPPTKRNAFTIVELDVLLRSGNNEITLSNITGSLSLDYMDILDNLK